MEKAKGFFESLISIFFGFLLLPVKPFSEAFGKGATSILRKRGK